jgi:hypothetical protein
MRRLCDIHIQYTHEAWCCQEMESCRDVLKDNLVLEDLPQLTQPPCCITLHSRFRPICLEKWALRKLARKYNRSIVRIKVIPQFCIAHFYCAHLITYNFIHYTYRLKKNHFMTILCYFKTSLVTFVQRITLKSMFSKKAYKRVARVPVSVVYLFARISRFNATIP